MTDDTDPNEKDGATLEEVAPWSFTVPGQPPSWNHAYKDIIRRASDGRSYRSRAKTDDVITYQRDVGLIVGAARPAGWSHDGKRYIRLAVALHLGRDIDATNVWKVLEDAIARKLGVDDKWFLGCFVHKSIGVKDPFVKVTIT